MMRPVGSRANSMVVAWASKSVGKPFQGHLSRTTAVEENAPFWSGATKASGDVSTKPGPYTRLEPSLSGKKVQVVLAPRDLEGSSVVLDKAYVLEDARANQ